MSSRPCCRAPIADADGVADAGSDDTVGAEQPDRAIVEMHGAAAAAANAVGLAEQLGHHAPRDRPLGQRVAVAAMGGGDPVGRAQMRADADAGRLLADVEMQEARASRPCGRRSARRFRSAAAAPSARTGRAGLARSGRLAHVPETSRRARRRNCHQCLPELSTAARQSSRRRER